ncbi:MAG: circularly permuted type 2 ATP-grasp protein [Alphaproteobacteria bacterium]|nr:circularly permuted type 2 ATP-grasp protein [Alphaproteobacteria bacterium]
MNASTRLKGLLSDYDSEGHFCEMFGRRGLSHTRKIRDYLDGLNIAALRARARDAERELFNLGITFTVYTDRDAIDRILPFDVIPRILSSKDWKTIETGVKQRIAALNLFLYDIYHSEKILKDGVIPIELVKGNANYRPEMHGFDPPQGTYVHICGIDIVRDERGRFLVLEDNARTPSGVSYVIENRHLMMRAFPDLAEGVAIADVDDYGRQLAHALTTVAPPGVSQPTLALLSPGVYNSAYFEHVFLAREMGAPLVEGQDLVVEKDKVFMRTTTGLKPVHVIYRRLNDDFLDPGAFRPDSHLGVPGLFRAYRKGNVTLVNAVGTGVADDKAVYAYMPRIIRYYLDEEPILANVETNICREPEGLKRTLAHLDELVTKPVGESGGYGVVIGPRASKRDLAEVRAKLKKDPKNFISQPLVQLSVSPTLIGRRIEPRHVDLRPFALTGDSTWVLPGGLTRVALRRGSLVVNSSQGGGSKDTWVLV